VDAGPTRNGLKKPTTYEFPVIGRKKKRKMGHRLDVPPVKTWGKMPGVLTGRRGEKRPGGRNEEQEVV